MSQRSHLGSLWVFSFLLMLGSGCGDFASKPNVRTYREVQFFNPQDVETSGSGMGQGHAQQPHGMAGAPGGGRSSSAGPMGAPGGSGRSPMTPPGQGDGRPPSSGQGSPDVSFARPQLDWELPNGWGQQGGSDMRVATFFPEGRDQSDDAPTCSLVALPGKAGGLENNLRRWLRQLGVSSPAPSAIQRLKEQATSFVTRGDWRGKAYDLTPLAPRDRTMLVSIIRADGTSLFVKMVGEESAVQSHRKGYMALCRSLQKRQKNGADGAEGGGS